MNYPEIQKLFGTPLSQVPKPNLPFQWKTWHVVGLLSVAFITCYGLYAIHRDLNKVLDKMRKNNELIK